MGRECGTGLLMGAGLLLAAAYMLTRRLWMSIGFHMAWNYTQSGIFSGIVSGAYAKPGLIKVIRRGNIVPPFRNRASTKWPSLALRCPPSPRRTYRALLRRRAACGNG